MSLTDPKFLNSAQLKHIHVGVKSYDVSLESQTADVYADEGLEYETVLEKIKKTGKTITGATKDGEMASF